MNEYPLINRDLSWLSFNERVLQEAEDKDVPLIERIKFLGIYSNNLDEFFRVRVAVIRRYSELDKKAQKKLNFNPVNLLESIKEKVSLIQRRYTNTFHLLLHELEKENVFILNETQLNNEQTKFITEYFVENVRPLIVPIILNTNTPFPSLRDEECYLAVNIHVNKSTPDVQAIIDIPSSIDRFVELPSNSNQKCVMFVDDVIRYQLKTIFSFYNILSCSAFAFKVTRDAELDFDDDISLSLIESMEHSVAKRKKGKYVRFIYDKEMPANLVNILQQRLKVKVQTVFDEGGKYHNKKDLMNFPSLGLKHLNFKSRKSLKHLDLEENKNYLNLISNKDVLLHYPYHDFTYNIDVLRQAAIDPSVTSISINLYRVAKNSNIINALVVAHKNGKNVTVVVELKARFDEENNIKWAHYLQEEGVKVVFGVSGIKVHSKLILIERLYKQKKKYITHIGTGNFHEKTAKFYTDLSLWTANENLTKEVKHIFSFYNHNYKHYDYKHLLVSPYSTRNKFEKLIDNEINNAKDGKKANITLKLNNLVDESLINKLYEASNSGVKVKIICRGICALVPGVKDVSENIQVYSIVGRYLEHTRIMKFFNDGDPLYFMGSADWMKRNLDNRVEVITPIYDKNIKIDIENILKIQFEDNCKTRVLDEKQHNEYKYTSSSLPLKAQLQTYLYFKKKLKN